MKFKVEIRTLQVYNEVSEKKVKRTDSIFN